MKGPPFELRPVAAATVVGGLTTAIVLALPEVRFAYESLELHITLESTQGLVALLLAYLTFGRLRLRRCLPDLLLTGAFGTYALSNLLVAALPIALKGQTVEWAMWAVAAAQLLASALLAAAALAPDRRLSTPSSATWGLVAMFAAFITVVTVAVLGQSAISAPVDPTLSPDSSARPLLAGHGLAIGLQVVNTAVMIVAAWAFAVGARLSKDDFVRWMAAGAVLGVFARLNYVLFPSLFTEWVYVGDLLRFGAYLFFLTAAAREISSYWRRQANHAVLEERRRVARELHDGLTQELSFIRSQLVGPSGKVLSPEMAGHVADAAERALTESRRAIDVLREAPDGASRPLGQTLRAAALDVSTRSGVDVAMRDDPTILVSARAQWALERIVREAVANAIAHGQATEVVVSAHREGRCVSVTIADDGCGFDVTGPTGDGFGLAGMRERAETLGGTFDVESSSDGTCVRAAVPVGP